MSSIRRGTSQSEINNGKISISLALSCITSAELSSRCAKSDSTEFGERKITNYQICAFADTFTNLLENGIPYFYFPFVPPNGKPCYLQIVGESLHEVSIMVAKAYENFFSMI
jgi:hypothetical protein